MEMEVYDRHESLELRILNYQRIGDVEDAASCTNNLSFGMCTIRCAEGYV